MGRVRGRAGRLARFRRWFDFPRALSPSASFDGGTIYLVSDRGGHPQAWKVPRRGGRPTLYFPSRERVDRISPSPWGPSTVVASDRGGDERWQLSLVDGAGRRRRALTSDPNRIHRPGRWADARRYVFSSNARDVRYFDVYEIDVSGRGRSRRIREEDALVDVYGARDDTVLLQRANTNLDADLILRRGSSETRLNPHSGEQIVFDADLGRTAVYAAANPEQEFAGLLRFPFRGDSFERLVEFSGDVEKIAVDPKERRVATVVNDRGWSALSVFDLDRGEARPVTLPSPGVIGSVTATPDGEEFLFDLSSPNVGVDIYAAPVERGSARRLTRSPGPFPGPRTAPRLEEFRARDGLTVPYWVIGSTASAKATVVYIHGGPEAQSRPGFSALLGFLRGEGFRLVVPNVRGSLGYGATYLHLDDVRRRMDSVRDIADLMAHLRSRDRGSRSSSRVGVMGGSYGGFMVLSSISTYPDLFDAAVDIVGISNFITFLERTAAWRRKVREDEYGSLERDREFLREISPLFHADRIRTPLFVVHGANDPRVPLYEAEQIVAALERRRVPVEFLKFGDEGHGLVRRKNQETAVVRAAEFLARHLAPPRRVRSPKR